MNEQYRVLVIDDEEMIRVNLQAFLEDEGFLVVAVPTAEDGLVVLDQETIHFVIVDMRLPGMNGNDFILQAKAKYPTLPVVVYTGSSEYKLPPALERLGVTERQVLMKPLPDMTILLDLINEALHPHP